MKIAVASSGLGRVLRGIETSCLELARALHERGVDVTLFAAGETGTTDYRLPTTDYGPRTTDNRLQTADHRLQTTDCGPPCFAKAATQGRQTTDNRPETRDLAPVCVPDTTNQRADNGRHSLFTIHYSPLPVVVLDSLSRDSRAARLLGRLSRWWGLKNEYAWEQFSFWLKLWPHLRRGKFDILHVQDPMLAYWCMRFRKLGLVRTREILGYGSPMGAEFVRKLDRVQFYTPWHLDEMRAALSGETGSADQTSVGEGLETAPAGGARSGMSVGESFPAAMPPHPGWVAIPHFVDTERYTPAGSGEERGKRKERMGLPENAFVVGTVAAIMKEHKRIDYLIREFAAFANGERQLPVAGCQPALRSLAVPSEASGEGWGEAGLSRADESPNSRISESSNQRINVCPPFLLICGARTADTDELVKLAEELCLGRVKFLFDVPHDDMPDVYRAMDVFVLASLWEPFGLVLIEAMASGVPVVVHSHPSIQWILGAGSAGDEHVGKPAQHASAGGCLDMSLESILASFLRGMSPEWISSCGKAGRERAVAVYAKDVVIRRMIEYYRDVDYTE